jgi:hypothetical protein
MGKDKDQLAAILESPFLAWPWVPLTLTPANAELEAREAYRQHCEDRKAEVNRNIVKRKEQ